jgi:hypothetical protein
MTTSQIESLAAELVGIELTGGLTDGEIDEQIAAFA